MMIDQKIRENEKLIYQAINDLEYIPEKADRDELEQIGRIGLWKAIEKFDEDYGVKFSTYAYNVIKKHLIWYLRDMQRIKRKDVYIEETFDDTFEDEIIGNTIVQELDKYLSQEDKNIFLDKHLGGLTLEQLCKKYNLSMKAVRYRFDKAKKTLINNLKWEE